MKVSNKTEKDMEIESKVESSTYIEEILKLRLKSKNIVDIYDTSVKY